jgi:hypothetical protein
MQGHSDQFAAAVRKLHTAVCRVDVIQDGKVVAQLPVHAGSVTADRTAAQMRSFETEVADPSGVLLPEGMDSMLAPFGTRIQLYRGVRLSSVDTQAVFYNNAASWVPSGTSTGVLNSVKVSSGGTITLGP